MAFRKAGIVKSPCLEFVTDRQILLTASITKYNKKICPMVQKVILGQRQTEGQTRRFHIFSFHAAEKSFLFLLK